MSDPEARFQQLVDKVRQRGGRLTPQRVAILRILAASEGHPSVEQIYDQIKDDFPTTGMATIYKTVALLKEMDEVLELGFADGSNRYDGNRPHSPPAPDLHPMRRDSGPGRARPGRARRADRSADSRKRSTMTSTATGWTLYGTCHKCQAAGAQASRTE